MLTYNEELRLNQSEELSNKITADFAQRKIFDKNDPRAIRVRDMQKGAEEILSVISGVELFILEIRTPGAGIISYKVTVGPILALILEIPIL